MLNGLFTAGKQEQSVCHDVLPVPAVDVSRIPSPYIFVFAFQFAALAVSIFAPVLSTDESCGYTVTYFELFPLFNAFINDCPYFVKFSLPLFTKPAVLSHVPPDISYIPYIVPVVLAFVPLFCVHTYTPDAVLLFNSVIVVATWLASSVAPAHPVTAYTLLDVLFKFTLFIYIFAPFNPYLLWLKYATAPHSLFFIIWLSVELLLNPYIFPLSVNVFDILNASLLFI